MGIKLGISERQLE